MRLAVPLMTRYGIAMTPQNYAVLYEYVSGANMQLSETIDIDLAEHGTFTNQRTTELYERFLGPEKEELNLQEQRTDLRQLLQEIQKFAQKGSTAASQSTEQLADALAKLHPDMSREQIHDVIHDVMNETKHAMSSSQQLTERLMQQWLISKKLKLILKTVKTSKNRSLDRLSQSQII